jgi:uncharacterized damage-inducible protein DinB
MKITDLIAQHILEVHEGNNWTEVDVTSTLADVSLKEATMQTIASTNTIAALLQHLTYWNRAIVKRINGIFVAETEDNGYFVPVMHDEEDWQRLKEDNLLSAHELAAAIKNVNESALELPILPEHSTAYRNLQGSVEHVHYHLGQMVILKQLIRAQKKEPIF